MARRGVAAVTVDIVGEVGGCRLYAHLRGFMYDQQTSVSGSRLSPVNDDTNKPPPVGDSFRLFANRTILQRYKGTRFITEETSKHARSLLA